MAWRPLPLPLLLPPEPLLPWLVGRVCRLLLRAGLLVSTCLSASSPLSDREACSPKGLPSPFPRRLSISGLKLEPKPPLAAGARVGAESLVPWGCRPDWLWGLPTAGESGVGMPLLKEALPFLPPVVLLLGETGPDGLARPDGAGGGQTPVSSLQDQHTYETVVI